MAAVARRVAPSERGRCFRTRVATLARAQGPVRNGGLARDRGSVASLSQTVTLLGGHIATDRLHIPVACASVAKVACVVARIGHIISVLADLIPQRSGVVSLLRHIVSHVCGHITPVASIVALFRRFTGPRGLIGTSVAALYGFP